MNTDPVIRIHAADNVVIARRQLLGGTVVESEGITVAGLIPPGHKVATRRSPRATPVRRYNQVIGFATQADRARPACAHAQPGLRRLRARPRARRRRAADRLRDAARHLRRHRARRRPRGHAQLHRRADQRELLGHRRARDRRPVPPRHPPRGAGRLSERRRRRRADPWHGLRHRQRRRGTARAAPHARRLCAGTRTSPPCWWSAWAARRTRSRA